MPKPITSERLQQLFELAKLSSSSCTKAPARSEREFLADIVLPDGKTVHEVLGVQLVGGG